jgi:signal peptidase I
MSPWSLVIASSMAAAALVFVAARRCLVVVTVAGRSMAPALMPGDRVLVRRGARTRLRAGLIVVFGQPCDECPARGGDTTAIGTRFMMPADGSRWTIKRVAAVPGDTVPEVARPAVGDAAVVPPGMLVVLGDNAGSADSRTWGFLSTVDVLGVAVRRLSPSGSRPEI